MEVTRHLPEEAIEDARAFCRDEYQDYLIYKEMASREADEGLKRVLERFAEQEYNHYQFWKELTGEDCKSSISRWTITKLRILRRILGLTFALKYLELHEEEVIKNYKRYLEKLQGEDRRRLEEIIKDELEHESNLLSELNESIVRYLSFIALGLADAIVEITGVHAGFLGATKETLVAGIAGLIVGVSAAFSMAGAAYLQAKAEIGQDQRGRHPGRSAAVTGISYLAAVIILALPYFITQHQLTAFAVSVGLAIVIVSGFTFYNSVLNEAPFKTELTENLLILFGTATIAFIFGDILGGIFGLEGIL
ncbi:MAG: rubrerythrin family protein [Desulfurococcales archaeon]|nr:rubrerythrin family protein [Desulfurococcales archaeon]